MATAHEAVLLIAFGAPGSMAEVRPFLDNVLRGRPLPAERLEAVVRHYERIGGKSPLTELTLRQAQALEEELHAGGLRLPVYVGMRNWTPYLHETLRRMIADGVRRAVGVIMAAQQTDASSGRYTRAVAAARARAGRAAPEVDFAGDWHAHPLFIEAVSERVAAALASVPAARRPQAMLVFTAHSVPAAMAAASPYVEQVRAAARLVAQRLGHTRWSIAYQSRSGDPRERWLEPDILEAVRELAGAGVRDLVVVPIGFVCDHLEVLYDLDIEARQAATQAGASFIRAATVNDHPAFIHMLAEVVRQTLARRQGETA